MHSDRYNMLYTICCRNGRDDEDDVGRIMEEYMQGGCVQRMRGCVDDKQGRLMYRGPCARKAHRNSSGSGCCADGWGNMQGIRRFVMMCGCVERVIHSEDDM